MHGGREGGGGGGGGSRLSESEGYQGLGLIGDNPLYNPNLGIFRALELYQSNNQSSYGIDRYINRSINQWIKNTEFDHMAFLRTQTGRAKNHSAVLNGGIINYVVIKIKNCFSLRYRYKNYPGRPSLTKLREAPEQTQT